MPERYKERPMKVIMLADAQVGKKYYGKSKQYEVSAKEYEDIKQSCMTGKQLKEYENKMLSARSTKGWR